MPDFLFPAPPSHIHDMSKGGFRGQDTDHTTSRPTSQQLISYWNSLRRGLDLPKRTEIDPRAIQSLLPYTFILERIAPGLARFRVAGTYFSDLMGMDVRGMPFSCLMIPETRDSMVHQMARMFDHPGSLHANLTAPGGPRRPEMQADLAILPLRDCRDIANRAIGCLIAKGQTGVAPRRFLVNHVAVKPVLSAPDSTACAEIRLAPVQPGRPDYLRLVLTD